MENTFKKIAQSKPTGTRTCRVPTDRGNSEQQLPTIFAKPFVLSLVLVLFVS